MHGVLYRRPSSGVRMPTSWVQLLVGQDTIIQMKLKDGKLIVENLNITFQNISSSVSHKCNFKNMVVLLISSGK